MYITRIEETEKTETMTDNQSIHRRTFLRAAGGITIASVLAGCTGGSSGDSEPKDIESWLSETDNFDSVKDKTGTKSVTVEVGPKGSENTFEPAAIKISRGTTVVWKWIGTGSHNVVATDEVFNSGSPETSGSFEHTFEKSGTYYYYCDPHKALGMKGAVEVTDSGGSE